MRRESLEKGNRFMKICKGIFTQEVDRVYFKSKLKKLKKLSINIYVKAKLKSPIVQQSRNVLIRNTDRFSINPIAIISPGVIFSWFIS